MRASSGLGAGNAPIVLRGQDSVRFMHPTKRRKIDNPRPARSRSSAAAATTARAVAVAGGFLGLVVAQMAAGQRNEDVLQADLPGRQPDEVAPLGLELVDQ